MLSSEYIMSIERYNKSLLQNSFDLPLEEKRNLSIEEFEKWFSKNKELGYKDLFNMSFDYFEKHSFNICRTHLIYLFEESEQDGIESLNSKKYSEKLFSFYKFCKQKNIWDFWLFSRLLTLVDDSYVGEVLSKDILMFIEKNHKSIDIDNTSLEYFKIYVEDFLIQKKTFLNWLKDMTYSMKLIID